jgi:transposase
MKILAIDLGKSNSVACVYEGGSGEHRFRRIRTTPAEVHDLIVAEAPARVVVEIGPTAGWVCDLCGALSVEVQAADTTHEAWRWKSLKRKSDRDDALKLARLSAMNQVHGVHVPGPEVRAWRELIAFRHALVARRTAVKNSIRSILDRRAIAWPEGPAGWNKTRRRELDRLAREEDGALWRLMLREELEHLDRLRASIARIEARLDALAEGESRVALLRTIPGVGRRLAETVVAVIDDPHRFATGKQVGCYAGLTPRRYQSGSMDRQGRISGRGPTLLRSLLVEVAWLGRRWNPWMKRVYERALRGSPSRKKIAITALARRRLVVCWAMLRDGTPWRGAEGARLRLAA